MAAVQGNEPKDDTAQRRKARRTVLYLVLFALAVYIVSIIVFVNRN